MVVCQLCHKEFKRIEGLHLKFKHGISMAKYKAMFPEAPITSSETSSRVSRANKKRWAKDRDYRENMSNRMKGENNIVYMNPISSSQRSNAAKKVWSRVGYKKKMIQIHNTDEMKRARSKLARKTFNHLWDNEEWREAKRQAILGKNNPQWKGGNSPKYYGPNWRLQRRKVRKRDNYTCQLCGATEKELGQQLDIHHKIPFREFGYVEGENKNYRDANKLDNLIGLCMTCHKMVEWHPELID